MQIRDDIRQMLASEFSFAVSKMEELPHLPMFGELLFYYSAFFGAINRAVNLEWNRELVLLHFIMQFSHAEMNAIVERRQLHFLDEMLPQHLTDVCKQIAQIFSTNTMTPDNLYPLIARITELSYSTTGNGRYNLRKGNLVL